MDWLPAEFLDRLPVSLRQGEHPSALRWLLAPPAMVNAHTTTTTTITTYLSTASTVAAMKAAAGELPSVGEPRSTGVSPCNSLCQIGLLSVC